jgi:diamine N-acetyltransferase
VPPSTTDTSAVSLREVTASTVRAIADLRVSPEQEGYVASNAVSIAQAYFHPEAWFRCIHAGTDPVGFVMLRDGTLLMPPQSPPQLSLWRFMIDRRYQGLGFGRRALELVVAHARTRPGIHFIHSSYVVGPHGPLEFYLSFGFRHTGEVKPNGEVAIALELGQCAGEVSLSRAFPGEAV